MTYFQRASIEASTNMSDNFNKRKRELKAAVARTSGAAAREASLEN